MLSFSLQAKRDLFQLIEVEMASIAVGVLAGIAGQLFLGEAYPSGRAYVQPFRRCVKITWTGST